MTALRAAPTLRDVLPPLPPRRGFFTSTRWWVICHGPHRLNRRGWPYLLWRDRLSLLGSLMNKERRA